MTPEEMWWGDAHVRWDDVVEFGQLITVQNGYETIFEVNLRLHDGEIVKVLYFRNVKRDHTPRSMSARSDRRSVVLPRGFLA